MQWAEFLGWRTHANAHSRIARRVGGRSETKGLLAPSAIGAMIRDVLCPGAVGDRAGGSRAGAVSTVAALLRG